MSQPPGPPSPGSYTTLPLTGPHSIGVGHALITLVEPHPGHERAYNRWYEDDHMFSGALYLPWLFSGRRWVATHDLQQLRFPRDHALFDPLSQGCYLSTYWITPGRIAEHKEWSFSVYNRLVAECRVNDHRDHVFTSFQDKSGTVYHSPSTPRDVFTLLDPSPGLVMEILDADDEAPDSSALRKWLLDVHLPARVSVPHSPVDSAMVFATRPLEAMPPEVLARIGEIAGAANEPRRVTVLWFLKRDPREVWEWVAGEEERVKAGGEGRVRFCAPFVPARMGTNEYDDQLRG
ncbi:uncharacterized protein BDZ99DRAFT_470526 [Mytilinidion resinicola]|uniref:Uncharacterized protein n=1 Tax=Mytilinidion resinicola TaxID=574789 RepID=A0A6A6ZBD7_9PEZI|nr:uncharacterized protein BDZ99DRAFT_470526 [Mytilinidion resinicola]KAF2817537.1 hypothetical protein BDZ99DRAFT_470526 [Mytilinidion resinicola]